MKDQIRNLKALKSKSVHLFGAVLIALSTSPLSAYADDITHINGATLEINPKIAIISTPEVAPEENTSTANNKVDDQTNNQINNQAQDKANETKNNQVDKALVGLTLPGYVNEDILKESSEIIIIDNDEDKEVETTIQYHDLQTDDSKTKAKAGAKFPVVITSQLSSKTAKLNDPIIGRLKYDLKIGDRLIAAKDSMVIGHINYVLAARSTMHALLSPERWYRNSGTLGIAFDEIINERGEHLPLVAQPARCPKIIKNKGEGRVLGVNHNGQVVGPWSQQLKYKAIRIGLNAALSPAGVFSFGAMPVALGVIGAANPSFAFTKPIGLNVRHRRLKGFAWGFLSGVPGSWIVEDTVIRGQEAIIKPGDEFQVEFEQEFTGEPEMTAQLVPGADTSVHGQVVQNK